MHMHAEHDTIKGVGDRTDMQHIDPHSYGHQRFFPVLLGCSTGGLGSQPLWYMFLNPASSLQLVWSPTLNRGPEGSLCWVLAFSTASCLQLAWSPNWLNFLCTELYNSSTSTFFLWASPFRTQFNPSTVKVIISWYSSTGCTCYLYKCISYIDSPAGS